MSVMPIQPMNDLENAWVRISVLETQLRHKQQEIDRCQLRIKELDDECRELSAENSSIRSKAEPYSRMESMRMENDET